MSFTYYSIIPVDGSVSVDNEVAFDVNMAGIPLNVHAIQWDGIRGSGTIEYKVNPETGVLPTPGSFSDPDQYITQVAEAEAIIEARNNPVIFYFTAPTTYEGLSYALGDFYVSTTVGHPAPPSTTTSVPPAVTPGQTLYWYDGAWVVSSFDPSQTLPAAKATLTQTVTQDGASAVNVELGLYSNVQQITAPDVNTLDAISYPGSTIGEYQTYVDGLIASAVSTINAATSTEDLYSFNPSDIPFIPESSGVIFTGRGAGLGPEDLNVSYFVTWNSTTVVESDTELYVPGTATVIPYGSAGPNEFDSVGDCFNPGDYTVQIRQASTGFVLASFECPLNPAGENVSF